MSSCALTSRPFIAVRVIRVLGVYDRELRSEIMLAIVSVVSNVCILRTEKGFGSNV